MNFACFAILLKIDPNSTESQKQLETHSLWEWKCAVSVASRAGNYIPLPESPWRTSVPMWTWSPPTPSQPSNQSDFLKGYLFRFHLYRADRGLSDLPMLGKDGAFPLQQWKWLLPSRQACTWPCAGKHSCLTAGGLLETQPHWGTGRYVSLLVALSPS